MKTLLLAIGGLLLVAGCTNSSSQTSGAPQAAEMKKTHPQAEGTVVRHTHLPIDYLITGQRIVRVNDRTTGKQLWQQPVASNTHLRISAQGITVNNSRVYSRKLKEGDIYEIVLVRN